jgi:hypothetical protein
VYQNRQRSHAGKHEETGLQTKHSSVQGNVQLGVIDMHGGTIVKKADTAAASMEDLAEDDRKELERELEE